MSERVLGEVVTWFDNAERSDTIIEAAIRSG